MMHDIGTQVQLSNTYHLHVRTGDKTIRNLVVCIGLWYGIVRSLPIPADFRCSPSEGLQRRKEGVYFQSHIDGHKIFMGPEESMQHPVQFRINDCNGI